MGDLVVTNHITLDGVMQSPGRPDEDTRGGFAHGGWAAPNTDEVMAAFLGKGMSRGGALLLGRRTYEDFFGFWPKQPPSQITETLDNATKYVASHTLSEPLPWENSVLLEGDLAEAVAELKAEQNIGVLGSGELLHSLIRADLVDRFVLMIHPLVLGKGLRLFPDDGPRAELRLVESLTTTKGVTIATYERVT